MKTCKECVWWLIYVYIIILTMMESCCVYGLCMWKEKTKRERIEYINKRKWRKVFGIIIILMMDVS